ncbi:polysaccharide biosynthesis C-terminal domain-containing protein (plasmid) [Haloferacaceae archaeon DSL9]
MKRSITSGFLSIVSTKFLVVGLGFLSSPLLTRYLGAGYGDYAFLMSIFAIYMIFVSSGISDGVRKYIAEERMLPYWDEYVVGFYLRLALILAAVGCLILAIGAESGFITGRFDDSYRTYFYLLAILVFTSQFREYVRRTLMGFGLERYSEPLKVLDKVLFIVVGVGLAFLGHGVSGVLIGHMVGAITVSVIGFVLISQQVSLTSALTRLPPDNFPRRDLFMFNGLSIVLILCLTSLYQIDLMMLRPLSTAQETGYYKISLTLAEFLWIVPLSLQNVLLHSTSNIWSQHDTERINSIAARVTRYTLLFTMILGLGLAALAPVAIPLIYPDDYIASYIPILLLLPGCIGFALARPILAIGQGKGDLHLLIAATGAAAVVNVILNALLIPRYGMHGAATATSVGYGLMFVFHIWSAKKIGFNPISDARLPQAIFAGALTAPLLFLVTRALDGSLLSLLIVPPFGALVFFSAAVLFGALDIDEVVSILASVPGPIGEVGSDLRKRDLPNPSLPFSFSGPQAQRFIAILGVLFLSLGLVLSFGGYTPNLNPSSVLDDNNTSDADLDSPDTVDDPQNDSDSGTDEQDGGADAPVDGDSGDGGDSGGDDSGGGDDTADDSDGDGAGGEDGADGDDSQDDGGADEPDGDDADTGSPDDGQGDGGADDDPGSDSGGDQDGADGEDGGDGDTGGADDDDAADDGDGTGGDADDDGDDGGDDTGDGSDDENDGTVGDGDDADDGAGDGGNETDDGGNETDDGGNETDDGDTGGGDTDDGDDTIDDGGGDNTTDDGNDTADGGSGDTDQNGTDDGGDDDDGGFFSNVSDGLFGGEGEEADDSTDDDNVTDGGGNETDDAEGVADDTNDTEAESDGDETPSDNGTEAESNGDNSTTETTANPENTTEGAN